MHRHHAGVYRFLLHLTRDPDRAEDLTQETFASAWRRIGGFRGRSAPGDVAAPDRLRPVRRRPPRPAPGRGGDRGAGDRAAGRDPVDDPAEAAAGRRAVAAALRGGPGAGRGRAGRGGAPLLPGAEPPRGGRRGPPAGRDGQVADEPGAGPAPRAARGGLRRCGTGDLGVTRPEPAPLEAALRDLPRPTVPEGLGDRLVAAIPRPDPTSIPAMAGPAGGLGRVAPGRRARPPSPTLSPRGPGRRAERPRPTRRRASSWNRP